MINNEFKFESSWWDLANQGLDRRPNALLLAGPKHTGKTDLALELAASWLCQSPLADRSGCGVCPSCEWMKTAQHPDFRWVRPDADAADAAEAGGPDAGEGGETGSADAASDDGKKKSSEIRIEQIRALAHFANVGSHRGGLRVVLISPANRMNYAAANALLKSLEEPADSLVFLLVADSLRCIPPTVLSRCRRLHLPTDSIRLSKIQSEHSEAAGWLLPLLKLADDVNPILWAEKAGKSPPADAIDLLIRWMTDVSRSRYGLAPRAFPAESSTLMSTASRVRSASLWAQATSEILRQRGVAEHPLNPKLFFESIFDRYRRAFGER
jgi:DNA polymerase-3 subunit delta'